MSKYFMMVGGIRFGPMTVEEMVRKGLYRETLVWKEGMSDYVPAHQVPELATTDGGLPPLSPPPVPAPTAPLNPPPTVPRSSTTLPSSTPRSGGGGSGIEERCWNCSGTMKRFLLFHSGTLGQMDLAFNIVMAIFTLGLWLIPMYMSPKKCVRCGKRQDPRGGGVASVIGLFLAVLFTLGMCLIPKLAVVGVLVGAAVAILLVVGKIFLREVKRGDDPS